MKKYLYIAIAAAALSSCSSDESLDVNKEEITFANAFVENATRAADPTYGTVDLTKFNVYGTVTGTAGTVNIFDGDEVTGNVGNDVWTCNEKQYWIAGATYNFAAVVDGDVKDTDNTTVLNSVTVNDNGMPSSITYTTSSQKDLLYATATATGQASGNNNVNFTFNHLLSKAQFTVTSNTTKEDNGYYYSVKNIKVNNFETGTYTISDKTWAGSTAKDIEFGNIEEVTAADTKGKTNTTQMLLIPSTTDFSVSFTVELYKANTKLSSQNYTKTVSQDLVAGHAYNFTIGLSVGELIQFTVTSDPAWAEKTDVEVGL